MLQYPKVGEDRYHVNAYKSVIPIKNSLGMKQKLMKFKMHKFHIEEFYMNGKGNPGRTGFSSISSVYMLVTSHAKIFPLDPK